MRGRGRASATRRPPRPRMLDDTAEVSAMVGPDGGSGKPWPGRQRRAGASCEWERQGGASGFMRQAHLHASAVEAMR